MEMPTSTIYVVDVVDVVELEHLIHYLESFLMELKVMVSSNTIVVCPIRIQYRVSNFGNGFK